MPAYHSKPSLICDFCPSDQRFAYSFLQIPPHGRHPCCSAIHFPLPGHVRDLHPLERAHGAQTKKGLLQQDLADELAKEGVTISYKAISNWERNLAEPSVTIFYKVCRILGITNMYEAYFGVNPADPFSSLTDEGREKAMDYINLLHASGMYEKQTAKIIPFRSIDIFENAVSAGTGNFLVDGPKETVCIDESILPEDTTFGVRISGDSMEPEFHDGQIAWVLQQESVANGEIGIFALNGEAYIKKLQNDKDGIFLISLNEKYAPIKVGENDRLDIFGKVLGKSDASAITGHYR